MSSVRTGRRPAKVTPTNAMTMPANSEMNAINKVSPVISAISCIVVAPRARTIPLSLKRMSRACPATIAENASADKAITAPTDNISPREICELAKNDASASSKVVMRWYPFNSCLRVFC